MILANWSLIYLISEWVIRLVMLIYVPRERSAAAARAWLLLIFLLPWPGIILYAIIGRIYVTRHRIAQQREASLQIRSVQGEMGLSERSGPRMPPNLEHLSSLATRLGDFEPFGGNKVELLTDYSGAINRVIADIDAATQNVHLLSYIYEDDETGQKVTDAIIRAAQRGVKCRLLLDAVGSKRGLARLGPMMRAAGVEVHAALRVKLFVRLRRNAARFDLRNHRKIVVIDGAIGHTGSQNIVQGVFVPGFPNEELMVRVTGPIVAQLQAVFLTDLYFETGVIVKRSEVFPELASVGETTAQVVPSGPGYQRENGQELMVAMLYAARHRVVLTTPYFVPDEIFLQAIRAAARRGVAVHLVVSQHANQLLTQLAQRSYYDELLEDGVNLYLYKPRFLHAKHLSIDDELAVVGSTNIDIRSFTLNSEINLVLYDEKVVKELRAVEEQYFANSEIMTLEVWRKRPLYAKTLHNVARLADTLL